MREITKYEAFDGRLFNNEQDCNEYEASHPFLNPKAIKFYSMNGKKIKDPANIKTGQLLRIPKLTPEQRDLNNPETRKLVDELAKEYLNQ